MKEEGWLHPVVKKLCLKLMMWPSSALILICQSCLEQSEVQSRGWNEIMQLTEKHILVMVLAQARLNNKQQNSSQRNAARTTTRTMCYMWNNESFRNAYAPKWHLETCFTEKNSAHLSNCIQNIKTTANLLIIDKLNSSLESRCWFLIRLGWMSFDSARGRTSVKSINPLSYALIYVL